MRSRPGECADELRSSTGLRPRRRARFRRRGGTRASIHRGCLVERIGVAGLEAIAASGRIFPGARRSRTSSIPMASSRRRCRSCRMREGARSRSSGGPGRAGDRLIGLFPLTTTLWRWGLPTRLVVGLTHNYGPLGTPLLDAADGETACEAFLDWARPQWPRRRFLLLPLLAQDGPAAAMLRTALTRERSSLRPVGSDRARARREKARRLHRGGPQQEAAR